MPKSGLGYVAQNGEGFANPVGAWASNYSSTLPDYSGSIWPAQLRDLLEAAGHR
jgi:hypothetical protein